MLNFIDIYNSSKTSQQVSNLRPTLLIGLGGTGKEVLRRIRRLFLEHYLDIKFPIVGYLWIDTDSKGENTCQRDLQEDPLFTLTGFKEDEKIMATIPREKWDHYFTDSARYPYIHEWLDASVQRYGDTIIADMAGAGQIRQIGRLGGVEHWDEIISKTVAICRYITNPKSKEATCQQLQKLGHQATIDNGLDIIIVASVAGGTGSGMLLDLPYLIKSLSKTELTSTQNVGILALPSVFLEDQKKASYQIGTPHVLYANAYATLSELEFYSFKQYGTLEDQTQDNAIQYKLPCKEKTIVAGSPYDLCYLIGNPLQMEAIEIYNMIAEYIFLEFEVSPFANFKRGTRNNSIQYSLNYAEDSIPDASNHGSVIYKKLYSRRFSSFGLSRISINRDKHRQAASYQLAQRLIKQIVERQDEISQDSISKLVQKNMEKFYLYGVSDTAPLMIALLRGDNDIKKVRITDYIKSKLEPLSSSTSSKDLQKKVEDIEKELEPEGSFYKAMNKNFQEVQKQIHSQLQQMIENWYQSYSLKTTQSLVKELYVILVQQRDKWLQRSAQPPTNDFNSYCEKNLREAEDLFLWLSNTAVSIVFPKAIKKAIKYLQDKTFHLMSLYLARYYEVAISLYESPAQDCPSYPKQIEGLLGKLQEVINNSDERFKSLSQFRGSDRNQNLIKNFPYDVEINKILLKNVNISGMAHHALQQKIKEREEKIFQDFIEKSFPGYTGNSLTKIALILQKEFPNGLLSKMVEHIFRELDGFAEGIKAVQQIRSEYGGSPEEAFKKARKASEPYIELNRELNVSIHKMGYCAYEKNDPDTIGRYVEDLQITTHKDDSILYYSEMAGIPLCIISDLTKHYYRYYLQSIKEQRGSERHLTKNYQNFPDIRLLSEEVACKKYQVKKNIYLGIILGIIYHDALLNDSGFVIDYREPRSLLSRKKTTLLGKSITDIEDELYRDEKLYAYLEKSIIKWSDENGELDTIKLLHLLDYYRSNVFSKVIENMHGQRMEIETGEHILMEKAYSENFARTIRDFDITEDGIIEISETNKLDQIGNYTKPVWKDRYPQLLALIRKESMLEHVEISKQQPIYKRSLPG